MEIRRRHRPEHRDRLRRQRAPRAPRLPAAITLCTSLKPGAIG